MQRIEQSLKGNTDMTQDVHDVILAARTGFKVLGALGQGVKWLGYLAAGLLSIWALIQAMAHGGPNK